jgi:hypothetical protein
MVLRYTLAWVPMVFIAIGNAIVREEGYRRLMGELQARQVSTVTAILLFSAYTWALTRRWRIESSRQAIVIGLIWLGPDVEPSILPQRGDRNAARSLVGHAVTHALLKVRCFYSSSLGTLAP